MRPSAPPPAPAPPGAPAPCAPAPLRSVLRRHIRPLGLDGFWKVFLRAEVDLELGGVEPAVHVVSSRGFWLCRRGKGGFHAGSDSDLASASARVKPASYSRIAARSSRRSQASFGGHSRHCFSRAESARKAIMEVFNRLRRPARSVGRGLVLLNRRRPSSVHKTTPWSRANRTAPEARRRSSVMRFPPRFVHRDGRRQ